MKAIHKRLELDENGTVWWKKRKNYPAVTAATPTMKIFPFILVTKSVAKFLSSGNPDDLQVLDLNVDADTKEMMIKFIEENY